ncbi:MAG TPA: hypothetical protein VG248_17195 [Caulobacteraceae bacterium]|jgi:hypothetical protein|nr:hypothetical protein [Caulobacteraceae bacterium]
MYRIDEQNNAGTIQAPAAPGAPGFFQDGSNPGAVVTADWLNTVQCELENVIVAAGIALAKPATQAVNDPDRAQLLAAIRDLIAAAIAAIPPVAPTYVAAPVLWVRYQLGSGTGSGEVLPQGQWTQRRLNTVVFNSITGASLAGNQFALPAGTYKVDVITTSELTGGGNGAIVNRLRDLTDGATMIVGSESESNGNSNANGSIKGLFAIGAAKTFDIESYAVTAPCNGGLAASSGEVEVYVNVYIEKIG